MQKKPKLTLPLLDHALELVVEQEDLDANVVLVGGGKLHRRHAKAGVSVNVDDNLLGRGDLGADRRGKTKAHGAEAARRNP